MVDAPADIEVMQPGLAEMRPQEGLVLGPQVERGEDPEPVHLGGGRRPDAVEAVYRETLDEARPHGGRDHK